MRHAKKFNHLGRTAAHRKAMLANMAVSLIEHKHINTTVAKAKALKRYVEPLITKAKEDNTHNRRVAFSYLRDKSAVAELFRQVVDKVGDRPGGYTRIIRTGNRLGDNAEMCLIELVDFNELYTNEKSGKGKKRRRRGGGAKKKAADTPGQTGQKAAEAPKKDSGEATQTKAKADDKEAKEAKPEASKTKKGDAEAKSSKDDNEKKS